MAARGRLAGKVALVTGAGGIGEPEGVGAAIARRFAAEGALVGVLDRDAARAGETCRLIETAGGTAMPLLVDVTDAAACTRAVAACAGEFGRLDILVNNAALVGNADLADEAGWERVLQVNLTGTMHMTRAALAPLVEGGGGAIVNIVSIAALRGFYGPAYSASKGGIVAFSATIAHHHGRQGIRVNCIAPGHIVAPMSAGADEATRARLRGASLLGSDGFATDISNGALFLASDEARWITGIVLPIDGGAIATTGAGTDMLNR